MSNLVIPTIKPTWKQHEAYEALRDPFVRFVFFGGGAGGGKSWLGSEWLMTNCYFMPGSRWFIGREELSRLMKSSYVTFQKVCSFHKIPQEDWRLDGKYNYIEFQNGSRIDLLDLAFQPRDPEFQRFGSLEYTGGWIEEIGEVQFGAFDVLKSRVGRHLNREYKYTPKLLGTCNPIKNWVYREIYKPNKENRLPKEYRFIQSLYKDNPWTAEEYGEALKQIKNPATKQRLMYGNWEYDDDPNTLISIKAINDLFTNTIEDSDKKYLSADIARYGQDKTVVYVWQGFKIIKIYVREKQGIDQTSSWIKKILSEEKIPYSQAIIDEDGVGGGVVDTLRGVNGFVNNSSPLTYLGEEENYQNLKTQCSFHLAEKINNHKIAIVCDDYSVRDLIVEELEQIKQKDADKEGKLKIIPKEEVKELIGRSPDHADGIMMRMWFELDHELKHQKAKQKRDKSATKNYSRKW